MTASMRTWANRRVPHTCRPARHKEDRPGDLWECEHGNIWVYELAISLYCWSEIYRGLQPFKFWRARRAIARARRENR